jgi:hypothetical protein
LLNNYMNKTLDVLGMVLLTFLLIFFAPFVVVLLAEVFSMLAAGMAVLIAAMVGTFVVMFALSIPILLIGGPLYAIVWGISLLVGREEPEAV